MAQTTSRPNEEPQTSQSTPPQRVPSPDGNAGRAPDRRELERTANAAADVPERPALAPNIVMSGEMEESGFAEPQWMVQRNGQFIHLTELLYHVAEQIDGQR
ncbi:MAG: hypothetical protein M3Y58_23305, partial [Chloroflexota bacterium]|nr:hypothetical protein [Chloroflexota bacterium]